MTRKLFMENYKALRLIIKWVITKEDEKKTPLYFFSSLDIDRLREESQKLEKITQCDFHLYNFKHLIDFYVEDLFDMNKFEYERYRLEVECYGPHWIEDFDYYYEQYQLGYLSLDSLIYNNH